MLEFLTFSKMAHHPSIFPVASLHSSILRSSCEWPHSFCYVFQSEHEYDLEKLLSTFLPIREDADKNDEVGCMSKSFLLS